MFTLVGIERKKGSSTDKQGKAFSWDNYIFYLLEEIAEQADSLDDDGNIYGQRVIVEKSKVDDLTGDLPEVGVCYEIYYNKYGKITKFVNA